MLNDYISERGENMFLFFLTSVVNIQEEKLNRDALDKCISEIAKGKDDAFEELYRRTSTSVYAYALSILKNTFDAQDVMHDTYLNIYRSAGTYNSNGKPMAWIFTIIKNEALKKLNSQNKFAELEEYEAITDESHFENVESNILINECFKILTDEEREIIIMHVVAGFKHREIADQLHLALSTVLSKYNRAIKKLRAEYEKEMNIQ